MSRLVDQSTEAPISGDTFPLARDGGVRLRPSSRRDPFEAWMDLMEAVEALCPQWPMREADEGVVTRCSGVGDEAKGNA